MKEMSKYEWAMLMSKTYAEMNDCEQSEYYYKMAQYFKKQEEKTMGNDYYVKHKSDRRVTLTRRDRIVLQTMLSMEIEFNEHELDKSIEPAFSVKHMKALYEKISSKNYDEVHGKEN